MPCPSVERDWHTDACSLMLTDVVTMSPTNVFTDYDMKSPHIGTGAVLSAYVVS